MGGSAMSVADYVSVFSAIIIGIAVADLAASFHRLMRNRAVIRWDWLALALVALVLLNLVSAWWASSLWYRGIKDMTIASYLPDLAMLLILFLAAATILPDGVPAERPGPSCLLFFDRFLFLDPLDDIG